MSFLKPERGQVLVMAPVLVILFLALFAVVVEGGLWWGHLLDLQNDLDAACIASAIAQSKGWNYGTAFAASMRDNQVEDIYFSPYENGPDGMVIRGVNYGPSSTIVAGAYGPHDFSLMQFAGIREMTVSVRSRCRIPNARAVPICVKEPWVLAGLEDPSAEYPILGEGAEADESRGSSFSGACVTQIWCSNSDCEPRTFFEPATESNSPNVFKDLWADTAAGLIGSPLVPINGRIPVLDGVSAHFEANTIDDYFDVGDILIVMVYNGTIDVPDPSYGNWESVVVEYYAGARITRIDANTVWASFTERLDNLGDVRSQLTTRTVQWAWLGEVAP